MLLLFYSGAIMDRVFLEPDLLTLLRQPAGQNVHFLFLNVLGVKDQLCEHEFILTD